MKKSVKEVKQEITPVGKEGKKPVKRFSRAAFENILGAIINDKEYKYLEAKVKGDDFEGVEELAISETFRKFIEKVLVNAGMDKEAAKVAYEMEFGKTDGLYEVIAAAIFEYIDAGNKFSFIPVEGFDGGSIFFRDKEETVEIRENFDPKTREPLGKSETHKKAHRVLAAKSGCPKYLKTRKKI